MNTMNGKRFRSLQIIRTKDPDGASSLWISKCETTWSMWLSWIGRQETFQHSPALNYGFQNRLDDNFKIVTHFNMFVITGVQHCHKICAELQCEKNTFMNYTVTRNLHYRISRPPWFKTTNSSTRKYISSLFLHNRCGDMLPQCIWIWVYLQKHLNNVKIWTIFF